MSQQPTCAGTCYVTTDWTYQPSLTKPNPWNPPQYDYPLPIYPQGPMVTYYNPLSFYDVKINHWVNKDFVGLQDNEQSILDKLKSSYEEFCKLENKHPDDERDFLDAIHKCQALIALRVARRVNPEIWNNEFTK